MIRSGGAFTCSPAPGEAAAAGLNLDVQEAWSSTWADKLADLFQSGCGKGSWALICRLQKLGNYKDWTKVSQVSILSIGFECPAGAIARKRRRKIPPALFCVLRKPAMPTLADEAIFAANLDPHLAAVNDLFCKELSSALPHVQQLLTHVGRFRGKMLRPVLVLLAGQAVEACHAGSGKLGNAHMTLAAVVEMVHVSTLVHDDILDNAEVRRRGATINYLHGNEAAVLLGDLLISHAFHLCSSLESQAASR